MRNSLNLAGDGWRAYLDKLQVGSFWSIKKRGEGGSAQYPGNFIPEIPSTLIQRYTREGERVADMFAGSETTADVCEELNREYIGCDLRPKSPRTTQADARWWKPGVQARLTILHPPYADIIDYNKALKDPKDGDLSLPWEEFLDAFAQVARNAVKITEPGGVVALVLGDLYQSGQHIPLAFYAMQKLQAEGLVLKGIIVKDFGDQVANKGKNKNLWFWRAVTNGFWVLEHEYLLVFQVPEKGRKRNRGTGPL